MKVTKAILRLLDFFKKLHIENQGDLTGISFFKLSKKKEKKVLSHCNAIS